jgi:hypothetical protein
MIVVARLMLMLISDSSALNDEKLEEEQVTITILAFPSSTVRQQG